MPVELLKPSAESVRHRVIREIIQDLIHEFPVEMKEVGDYMKLHTAQQINPKTGKWRTDKAGTADGYFKVSYPQIFMDVLRPIMREILPEEPLFADDDDDLFFVMKEFPDLIGGKNMAPPKEKKDYRTRSLIYSDDRKI